MKGTSRVLTIRSSGDALKHLRAIKRRKKDMIQPVELRFEGWPSFDVNVKGRRYQSSLPTPLMRALIEYQNTVNRVHAATVYESSSKALTSVDRTSLELVFQVKKGSTEGSADLWGWLNNLSASLVNKMSPRDLTLTVLAIALIASGYFGYSTHLDHKAQDLVERDRHEMEMELLRGNTEALAASEEFARTALNLVRQVPDATSVKIGRQRFTKRDIDTISEKVRGVSVPSALDGYFRVRAMKQFEDRWTLELVPDGSDEIIKTDLFRAERASAGISELSDAFASEQLIFLQLSLRTRDDVVTYARITGVGDKSFISDERVAVEVR